MLATFIYSLCALTACLCAFLLLKAYTMSRYRLLLWGGLCFSGLTINNILLVIDKMTPNEVLDLSMPRIVSCLASMMLLMYGLVWDTE